MISKINFGEYLVKNVQVDDNTKAIIAATIHEQFESKINQLNRRLKYVYLILFIVLVCVFEYYFMNIYFSNISNFMFVKYSGMLVSMKVCIYSLFITRIFNRLVVKCISRKKLIFLENYLTTYLKENYPDFFKNVKLVIDKNVFIKCLGLFPYKISTLTLFYHFGFVDN